MESPNYLLIYLDVENAKPGRFDITFTKDKKSFNYSYELKARKPNADRSRGLTLPTCFISSCRSFRDGRSLDDQIPMRTAYKVDRNSPNARHGGDLAGIEQHLDYIEDLGVTAIWLNPVLENDMEGGSYHGYATTDYYRVDPRFGTNEDYVRLIEKTHERGMRVVRI